MHTNKAIGQSTIDWVGNRVGDQFCKYINNNINIKYPITRNRMYKSMKIIDRKRFASVL